MKLTCTKCKVEKEDTDFYNDKRRQCGKNSWCKKCVNHQNLQRHKVRYKNDPIYRKKINNYQSQKQLKRRRDSGITDRRERSLERSVNLLKNYDYVYTKNNTKSKLSQSSCIILQAHAIVMKDDPERLTTKFMQNMIGKSCDFTEKDEL